MTISNKILKFVSKKCSCCDKDFLYKIDFSYFKLKSFSGIKPIIKRMEYSKFILHNQKSKEFNIEQYLIDFFEKIESTSLIFCGYLKLIYYEDHVSNIKRILEKLEINLEPLFFVDNNKTKYYEFSFNHKYDLKRSIRFFCYYNSSQKTFYPLFIDLHHLVCFKKNDEKLSQLKDSSWYDWNIDLKFVKNDFKKIEI